MSIPLHTNFTISAASPLFTYLPSRSGLPAQSWNATWSDTPNSQYFPDRVPSGTPTYTSTHVGASLEFGFPGTALWLQGSGQNYRVDLDGVQINGGLGGGVYTVRGLQNKWHNVKVTVQQSGSVQFSGAIFTAQLVSDGTELSNSTWTVIQPNGTPTSNLTIPPGWRANVAGTTNDKPTPDGYLGYNDFRRLDTDKPFAPVSFLAPKNVSFVTIEGSVSRENGDYAVMLEPKDSSLTPFNQSFNGFSPWLSINEIKYMGILNPQFRYNITIQLTAQDGNKTDLSAISFFKTVTDNGTDSGGDEGGGGESSSSGTPIGAIVGGVVGGVAALALAGFLIWFFVFRKKRRPIKGREQFEIDDYQETVERPRSANGRVEPFVTAGTTTHRPRGQSSPGEHSSGNSSSPLNSYTNPEAYSDRATGESTPFLFPPTQTGTGTASGSSGSPGTTDRKLRPGEVVWTSVHADPQPGMGLGTPSDPSTAPSSYNPPSSDSQRSPPASSSSHLQPAQPTGPTPTGPVSTHTFGTPANGGRWGAPTITNDDDHNRQSTQTQPEAMKNDVLQSVSSPIEGGGGTVPTARWQEKDAADERGAVPPQYDPNWAGSGAAQR